MFIPRCLCLDVCAYTFMFLIDLMYIHKFFAGLIDSLIRFYEMQGWLKIRIPTAFWLIKD